MSRVLILTPYEHGALAMLDHIYNKSPDADKDNPIDIPHILASALTMSGVDKITSIGNLSNSKSTLIKKITSEAPVAKWSEVYKKSEQIISTYKANINNEKLKNELDELEHKVSQLLFSLKTNSGIITFSNYSETKIYESLPLDLGVPFQMLMKSIQTKSANLPILKYEIEKKDVNRFLGILESKEFKNYRLAQSEIEQNQNLTNKTIKGIETAGKDLYKKNISHIDIRENVLKIIPLTTKVIDLFFGKLPGILADYTTNLLGDYLKLNKSIPIYNCEPIINEIKMASLRLKVLKFLESRKDGISEIDKASANKNIAASGADTAQHQQ